MRHRTNSLVGVWYRGSSIATGRYTPMQCSIEEMRQDMEGGASLVRGGKWTWVVVVSVIDGTQGATLSFLNHEIICSGTA